MREKPVREKRVLLGVGATVPAGANFFAQRRFLEAIQRRVSAVLRELATIAKLPAGQRIASVSGRLDEPTETALQAWARRWGLPQPDGWWMRQARYHVDYWREEPAHACAANHIWSAHPLMSRSHTPMRLLRMSEPFDHPEFLFVPKIDWLSGARVRPCASLRADLAKRTRLQIIAAALPGNCARDQSGLRSPRWWKSAACRPVAVAIFTACSSGAAAPISARSTYSL